MKDLGIFLFFNHIDILGIEAIEELLEVIDPADFELMYSEESPYPYGIKNCTPEVIGLIYSLLRKMPFAITDPDFLTDLKELVENCSED